MHGIPRAASGALFRKASCACGGGCPECQSGATGSRVSQPADTSEVEADQLADRVLRMPDGTTNRETEAKPAGRVTGSGGVALDAASRSFFEPRFGMDFGHVRVHSDSAAQASASSFQARAYTYANNIVFGSGEYRPHDGAGRELLAHELAHVALHAGGDSPAGQPGIHRKGDPRSSGAPTGEPVSNEPVGVPSADPPAADAKVLTTAQMRALGISLHIPDGEPIKGRTYRLGIDHPDEVSAVNSLSKWDFVAWFVKPPGASSFGWRRHLGPAFEWTLDEVGTWSFDAEVPMGDGRTGLLLFSVDVRDPDVVAMEKLNATKSSTEAGFLIGLEMRNLSNVNNALVDQRVSNTSIALTSGSNPAVTSMAAPNLPVNVYTASGPPDRPPAKYQWAAIPDDPGVLRTKDRFGQQVRTIEGQEAFDLGNSSTARWTPFWDAGAVQIACWMRDAQGQLIGVARYRQVVLTQAEARTAERFQAYMQEAHSELRKLRAGTPTFVPSVHLATETGQSNELSLFVGRAADNGDLMLVDVTPGVPRREYRGADFSAVLGEFNSGNAYPAGQVVLRVPANALGIANQDWRVMTEGASVARRLSTGWGWASLGLAGLGVVSALVGAEPLVPVFFMASATVGGASAAASLYDRAHEAHPSALSIGIDIAQLAGSMFGMAGAANVLRHGARIAAATRTGQFVLYAGFATDAVAGVFLAADGAKQIADILDSRMSTDEKVSVVVRILAGMVVNGTLLAWSASNLSATTRAVRGVLGEKVSAGLSTSDLTALSVLDERALSGLAGASQEEVQRIAGMIRQDPARAGRLAQVHGGGRFLEAARAQSGDLDHLARTLEMERRAEMLGIAASQMGTVITKESGKKLSKMLGVPVEIDPGIDPGRVEIQYSLGSWLTDTRITIKVGSQASVGSVLIHGIAMESIQEFRVLSGSFREIYAKARPWLSTRRMPRSSELIVELDKHALQHEASLLALNNKTLSPELERTLMADVAELEGWLATFRNALLDEGAPAGVIAVDLTQFKEHVSQGALERLLDRPSSNFERLRHSTSGNFIREPGFREGQSIDMGRSQKRWAGANVTYPDIYGTDLARGVDVAMEIKSPRWGETVASHFQKPKVAQWVLEQHGGREAHLPATAEYYLVIDLRACGQTSAQALADLSRVFKNYYGRGDVRRFWDGVRFLEGSWTSPTLSAPVVIP